MYDIPNDEKLKVSYSIKNKTAGVTVLTNQRIFFYSNILESVNSRQINIKDIQSADYKTALGLSTIRIRGITDTIMIDATKKTAEQLTNKSITNETKIRASCNK